MKIQHQGSWNGRWRQQLLEAKLELQWQKGLAEGLLARLEILADQIEMQMALVRLYESLANDEESEPP